MTNDTATQASHLRHVALDTPGALPGRVRPAGRVAGQWHVSANPWRHPVAAVSATRPTDATRPEGGQR